MLLQGRQEAEKALKEARQELRKTKQLLPKRSILTEINNVINRPRKRVGEDEPPAKKMKESTEVFSSSVMKPKIEKPKKVSSKKSIPQIKGQSKITAFMRV